MKKHHLSCLAALALSGLLSGCASDGGGTKVVDSQAKPAVVTTGIDPNDFKNIADKLAQSITSSGALKRLPDGGLPLVAISTVVNNTSQKINPADLTSAIAASIQSANQAILMLNVGVGPDGRPMLQDIGGHENQQIEDFKKRRKHDLRPDYTLSGTIDETYIRVGSTRQYNYRIDMRLAKGDLALWHGVEDLTKVRK